MGDLKGHVGQRTEGYEQVIGHNGIGQRNTLSHTYLNNSYYICILLYNTYFSRGGNFRYIREFGFCAKFSSREINIHCAGDFAKFSSREIFSTRK